MVKATVEKGCAVHDVSSLCLVSPVFSCSSLCICMLYLRSLSALLPARPTLCQPCSQLSSSDSCLVCFAVCHSVFIPLSAQPKPSTDASQSSHLLSSPRLAVKSCITQQTSEPVFFIKPNEHVLTSSSSNTAAC